MGSAERQSARTQEALERVGMAHPHQALTPPNSPAASSKRVAARAALGRRFPSILLADEPTGHLDSANVKRSWIF